MYLKTPITPRGQEVTDEDKNLVTIIDRSLTSKNWAECDISRKDVSSLCRIIRELEAKSDQRTNLSAVELTVHQSTARELAALKAEIENAPWVYGTDVGSDHGLKWREGHWVNLHRKGGDEVPRCDTHRARLVKIEKL